MSFDRAAKSLSFEPVRSRHEKAAAVISQQLRELIITDGSPGDWLPSERSLMDAFEVSRPTIREALRVLELEGFVEIRRGSRGGAVVRELDISGVLRTVGAYLEVRGAKVGDVTAARLAIEPAAAALAARRSKELGPDFREWVDRERQAIEAAESDAVFTHTVLDFHQHILQSSGNEILLTFGRLISELWTAHASITLLALEQEDPKKRSKTMRAAHRQHADIADAVIAGDAEEAEQRMRAHLLAAQRVLVQDDLVKLRLSDARLGPQPRERRGSTSSVAADQGLCS